MKKLLVLGLFPIFLLSFVSKWYVDVGFRIPYYLPVTGLWCILALPGIISKRTAVPGGLQVMISLKIAWLASLGLSSLLLINTVDVAAQQQFTKGFVMAGIDSLLIATILLFLTKLDQQDRLQVLRLYLAAAGCHLTFMVCEALGMYIWDLDVDVLISERIPFWSDTVVTMTEDRFYLRSLGTIYRLSGFTGDPNIAGVSLALTLPVIFYCYSFKPRAILVILTLAVLLLIASTVSNTAIPIAGLLLMALSARHWRRRKLLVTGIMVPLVIGAMFVANKQAMVLDELAAFKLPSNGGTTATHLGIAKDALALWIQHPFGLGLNNFALYSAHISTHNSYVQSLVELGVVGLIAVLMWLLGCLWLGYRSGNAIGTTAIMVVAALGLASNGHDILFRFEFQLLTHILVAMAVVERWQDYRAAPQTDSIGRVSVQDAGLCDKRARLLQ